MAESNVFTYRENNSQLLIRNHASSKSTLAKHWKKRAANPGLYTQRRRTLGRRRRPSQMQQHPETVASSPAERAMTGALSIRRKNLGQNMGNTGPSLLNFLNYVEVCDNLHGKRLWKRMDVCTCTIDPLCCPAEMINTVNQLYFNKTLNNGKQVHRRNITIRYWMGEDKGTEIKVRFLYFTNTEKMMSPRACNTLGKCGT